MLRALLFALALAGCAANARADDALAPLAPFMGCWRGEFQDQPDIHDERCFTPMLGGAFVRDVHYVRPTDYAGETIYVYDAHAGAIAVTYYSSSGGVAHARLRPEEGAFVFPEHVFTHADGSELRMRSIWRFENEDRFVVVTEAMEDGAWRPFGVIAYARVAE